MLFDRFNVLVENITIILVAWNQNNTFSYKQFNTHWLVCSFWLVLQFQWNEIYVASHQVQFFLFIIVLFYSQRQKCDLVFLQIFVFRTSHKVSLGAIFFCKSSMNRRKLSFLWCSHLTYEVAIKNVHQGDMIKYPNWCWIDVYAQLGEISSLHK